MKPLERTLEEMRETNCLTRRDIYVCDQALTKLRKVIREIEGRISKIKKSLEFFQDKLDATKEQGVRDFIKKQMELCHEEIEAHEYDLALLKKETDV